jgi:hypothetical protein
MGTPKPSMSSTHPAAGSSGSTEPLLPVDRPGYGAEPPEWLGSAENFLTKIRRRRSGAPRDYA